MYHPNLKHQPRRRIERSLCAQASLDQRSYILISLFISTLLWACQDPPPDPSGDLLYALQSQDWSKVKGRFVSAEQLETFPLKMALERGDRWIGLARLRKLDHHMLFEVDLKRDEALSRFSFWVEAPRPPLRGVSATAAENQSFSGEVRAGELGALGRIVGWSEPYGVKRHTTLTETFTAPPRFVASTYREPQSHSDYARSARVQLGVLDAAGGGVIESGWRGRILVQNTLFKSSKSRPSPRHCARVKRYWTQTAPLFIEETQTRCSNTLLLTAQRARYSSKREGEASAVTRVDVSRGRGGGRHIKAAQEQALKPSLFAITEDEHKRFNGRLTLMRSLALRASERPAPQVTESIIIAPELIRCLSVAFKLWSTRAPRSPCDIHATLYFDVERALDIEADAQ